MQRRLLISLAEAINALGICVDGPGTDPVPTDVSDINIICPMCGANHRRRRTMKLDFEENVFSCARCGFSGGVYKFISGITGWPLNEVPDRIKAGMLGAAEGPKAESNAYTDVLNHGRLIAPLQRRHEVYTAMLDLLTLHPDHLRNLRERGLDEESIVAAGFKSVSKYMDRRVIPKKLMQQGLDLRGVPGFGIDESGEWAMSRLPDGGFLIPNKNGKGLIQGFQIRFDHPNDRIPKYGYLTSKGMVSGTRCVPWCCWVGEDISNCQGKPFDVLIIEGPLKAYIVNCVTQANVLSVPGVNALNLVPEAISAMREFGLRCVYIAYDMDAATNQDVNRHLNRLREMLWGLNIPNRTMIWNPEFKGLDDYVTSSHFHIK